MACIVLVGAVWTYTHFVPSADAYLANNYKYCGSSTASTSPQYLTTTTATSTCEMLVSDFLAADLKWALGGANGTMMYETYFSDDDVAANRTWYGSRTFIVGDGEITHSSVITLNKIPIGAATTTAVTHIDNIDAKWMKIEYLPTAANMSVHLEINGRNRS